jgi:hypothetical protein
MSNWRPIILSDLTAASVSGKVTIIRNAASGRSLPDPAPAAIAAITQELRGAIGFSGKYIVDQDTTALPNALLDLAIKKIVREMVRSVNLPLTADEQADERTYESRLDKVRQGLWPIDPADNPVLAPQIQRSVITPAIRRRPRQFTRTNQDGI